MAALCCRLPGLAWKSLQSVCHAKHLSGFVYQACSGLSTLWQLMWQLHSGFQFSGHVVLERKQEDGTQLIWLPMMYITHPRLTSQQDGQARRVRVLVIWKQGLTDVAADDLWGSAEDPCHRTEGYRRKRQAHSTTLGVNLTVTWWTAFCTEWNIPDERLRSLFLLVCCIEKILVGTDWTCDVL